MNKNILIFIIILLLTITAPHLIPSRVVYFTTLSIFIVLAMTWDVQGGQMGYNSFGNIVFFGLGMYVCISTQVGLFFDVFEWNESGGEKTFLHTPNQYFIGLVAGLILAGLIPPIIAYLIGGGILGLRGHYFAIGTLGLGVAAAELAGGIDTIGGTVGMTVPVFPKDVGNIHTDKLIFYYLSVALVFGAFFFLRWLYTTRFGLALNAIRDDEDKAESMGMPTKKYKTLGWCISAFFLGIAGGISGNVVGYVDPHDIAFAGATLGVWMVLMAILGGKGTLWGPIIGAIVFYLLKDFLWVKFLGWQRVTLGFLIVIIVIFFPTGIMGYLRTKFPQMFGEVVDEGEQNKT